MSRFKSLEKKIFKETDPKKLYKYRLIYYIVVFIAFLVITYKYKYEVDLGSLAFYIAIFLILSEGSARVRRAKILSGSVGDMFSFALLPLIILVGLPLFANLAASNIYLMNFAVNESSLNVVNGKVIRDHDNNNHIEIVDDDGNRSDFVFDYPQTSFKEQEIYVPQETKVQIKYIQTNRQLPSKEGYYLLAYEVSSDDEIYLDYSSAKKYYIKFRSKAIKYILFSSLYYFISGLLIFILYLKFSKKEEFK